MWYCPMWPEPTTPARIRFCSRFTMALPLADPALRAGDELHEVVDVLGRRHLRPDDFEGATGGVSRAVQDLEGALQLQPDLRRHPGPSESHHVDATNLGRVALDEEIRRHVLRQPRA